MTLPGEKIVEVATRFLHLQETTSNAVWDDPSTPGLDASASDLRKLLEGTGWQAGWPYCAAFCEAVWRQAYVELEASAILVQRIAKRLTPSVMASFKNWEGQISTVPKPGALFFMQKGDSWQGHAGIVVRLGKDIIATIEGNTSPDPKDATVDREGDGVFRRVRSLSFTKRSGLWLRGFLNPLEVE